MPDLAEQLSAILSDPEAQRNIQSMLSSLGGGDGQGAPAPAGMPDMSGLASLLGGQGGQPGNGQGAAPPIDMGALLKIQQLFSRMNADDKNVALLRALKPHLREPGRVDEAIRLLQLISVLPALGESGIFGGRAP